MNTITTGLLLTLAYLVTAIIVLLMVVKLANSSIKSGTASTDRHTTSYGLYIFFAIVSVALFFTEVPALIHTAQGFLKSQPDKNIWGETLKLILIYSGFSLLFWVICFYISSKFILLLKKGARLSVEIVANEKQLVLVYGATILLLGFLLKSPFLELCKNFLPESGIPFYH